MKIISFSLWGDLPIYNVGAVENAKLRAFIYPGWRCRYYVDETVPNETITELERYQAEIVHMARGEGFKRLFWRFYPAAESNIERFVVRDCDSRLNIKEALAVTDWIASRKAAHIMRDNKCHNSLIQGGMWGGVGGLLPDLKESIDRFLERRHETGYQSFYNIDQMYLNECVWPIVEQRHLAHSIVKMLGNEKEFPILLDDGIFVGQVFDEYSQPLMEDRINPLI